MGVGDGRDDGQAQPDPAGGPGPGGVGALERLEDVRLLLGRDARAPVGHLEQAVPARRRTRTSTGAPSGVCRDGVGEQVVDHLAQAVGVTDRRGTGPGACEGDGAVRRRHPGGVHGGGDDGGQVDVLEGERPLAVEPGQQQQVVHEHAHAVGLLADVAHRGGEVLGPVAGAAVEELGVAADRRERRAQLVGGVGEEAPQALLRGGAGREGALDPA